MASRIARTRGYIRRRRSPSRRGGHYEIDHLVLSLRAAPALIMMSAGASDRMRFHSAASLCQRGRPALRHPSWASRRLRRGTSSWLEGDLDALRRQPEAQALRGRGHLDEDAVLLPQVSGPQLRIALTARVDHRKWLVLSAPSRVRLMRLHACEAALWTERKLSIRSTVSTDRSCI